MTTLGLGTYCAYSGTSGKLLKPSLSFLFCKKEKWMIMATQRNVRIK